MEEMGYTKDEIKASKRFKERQDIIEALLKDGVYYSIEEAEKIIKRFMKGRV
ncbi:MAG: hypothetical protein IKU60_00285 [Clostridia bacterium]|nr:hypothetical protein [Clostridia bacterium]